MTIQALVVETITNPASAAAKVCALATDRRVIWTGFALNAVLSGLIYGLQGFLLGLPSNAMFPRLSPVLFGLFIAVLQVSYALASRFAARWIGGDADFTTTLGFLVWLRFVNILVQVVAIILTFLAAPLALILNFAAALYGLYVLAHFTNVAFALNSLGKSVGVMLMAGFGALLTMVVLMSVLAPTLLETPHV